MVVREESFAIAAHDGAAIPVHRWQKRFGARAVVVISHGLAEHALRYRPVAALLAERDYAVYANDHRGHGFAAVAVEGASDSPSTILLAAWLTLSLDAPVTIVADPAGTGIRRVRLTRASGDVQLFRPGLSIAELTQPGQPAQRISLPRRSLRDCLAEELRRLDPDEVFGLTLGCVNAAPFAHPFG